MISVSPASTKIVISGLAKAHTSAETATQKAMETRTKDGLVEMESFDRREERHGMMCWGRVTYNRELSRDEIRNYALATDKEPENVEYKGFLIEWIEQEDAWRVSTAKKPERALAYVGSNQEAKDGIDELGY